MKLLISGSRNITDYNVLRTAVWEWAKSIHDNIPLPLNSWIGEIVEGGCKGVDELAARFAKEQKIDHVTFHANWDKYGKMGGPERNIRMAEYCRNFPVSHLLAIPETLTGGTANAIQTCKEADDVNGNGYPPIKIFVYDKCLKEKSNG
jgi:hypothetical protein